MTVAVVTNYEWAVTPERVEEMQRRIVAEADPLKIIAFGSRARGDHREDSDLDIVVVLDAPQEQVHRKLPYTVLEGLCMPVDMIAVSKAEYDDLRPWLNSVFNYADHEGVVLYDREHPELASPQALHTGGRRGIGTTLSAA